MPIEPIAMFGKLKEVYSLIENILERYVKERDQLQSLSLDRCCGPAFARALSAIRPPLVYILLNIFFVRFQGKKTIKVVNDSHLRAASAKETICRSGCRHRAEPVAYLVRDVRGIVYIIILTHTLENGFKLSS